MRPLAADLPALAAGGKAALARALTALETEPESPVLAGLLAAAWAQPKGVALGLTGPPGVGKSTLTSALIAALRARAETVAVIAVDPSSRRSGGALLGDRTRIIVNPEDAGVFVRSMAARQRLGGLADQVFPAMVLMRALFDWVIIETVGVGQSETEIADCADLVVFCAQPGSGDALQFMKAGVMEVPDVVLVTKGDLGPPAQRAAAEVRRAMGYGPDGGAAPVAIVSAQAGTGLAEALDLIATHERAAAGRGARRQEQGRDWMRSRLTESFGREGVLALAPRISGVSDPFAAFSELHGRVRTALHGCLKKV
jgi:LAO/AO transport system kinase